METTGLAFAEIHPQAIAAMWPHVKHLVLPAMERGKEMTEHSLIYSLLQGDMTLFIVALGPKIIGAATGEIQHYPVRSIAQIVHLGSEDFHLLEPFLKDIERWAVERGAHTIRMLGRLGFTKVLDKLGFVLVSCVMEKEI